MAIVVHAVVGAFDETRVAQLSTPRNTATVIVTMRYEDLIGRCGYATSTTGARAPVRDLLRKAADLRTIPAPSPPAAPPPE